jgi:GNAT superfamily N-acetyltransferase
MADFSIRIAHESDAAVLAELNAEVQDLHCAHRPDYFKPPNHAEIRRWFEESLRDPSARTWLAEVDARPVGYVFVRFRESAENAFQFAQKWWVLDQVGVRATHRKRGVCRALAETVRAEARSAGIEELRVESWAFNQSAHEAFQRLGFKPMFLRFEMSLT